MTQTSSTNQFKNRGIVILLSFLLTILLILLVIGLPITRTITQVGFFQNILHEGDFYQQLPAIISEAAVNGITEMIPKESSGIITQLLNKKQLETVLLKVLPDGWIEIQVDHFLVELMRFVNLNSNQVSFELDLLPIKQNLGGDSGKKAVIELLASIPECSEENIQMLFGQLTSGNLDEVVLCNPPEFVYSLFEPLIAESLVMVSDSIPPSINLPVFSTDPGVSNASFQRIYAYYRIIRISFEYLPWLCLGVAFLILLLSIRHFRAMLAALGIPLAIAGLAGGVILLLVLRSQAIAITQLSTNLTVPLYLVNMESMLVQIGLKVISGVRTQAIIVSGLTLGVGLLIILFSRLFKRRV